MKIDVKTNGYESAEALDNFAKCCAGFELGAQRSRIESVLICLDEACASRGGKDRNCIVEVNLRDGHQIITREVSSDVHVAIFRALERAGWINARRQPREADAAVALQSSRPAFANQGEPDWAA